MISMNFNPALALEVTQNYHKYKWDVIFNNHEWVFEGVGYETDLANHR